MGKHTPGPWAVGMRSGHNVSNIYARNGTDNHTDDAICSVYGIQLHTSKDEMSDRDSVGLANASLIAAAPDFLKMAYSALAWWEENKHATISLGDGEEDNLYDGEPEFVMQARAAIAKAEGKV